MKLEPVYPFLTNSLISDTGLEYYHDSGKALTIAYLRNSVKECEETYGFLFKNVQSISQKNKNENNASALDCDSIGMVHFLYQSKLDNGYSRFVFNTEFSFIIVKAEEVILIDGLEFM